MSEALSKATGIPDQPETLLLTVAKRELLQKIRSDKSHSDPALPVLLEDEAQEDIYQIPDARLRLMAVCCHPAIDEKVRMPLMLQCVLGLTVAQFAPALLTSPTGLAQRLVRAKQKIKVSGVRFSDADAAKNKASARKAYKTAIGLTNDPYVRVHPTTRQIDGLDH